MAGPVKGQWAGEEITLNDAATEVTLQAILDAITKLEKQKRDRKPGATRADAEHSADSAKKSADIAKDVVDTVTESSGRLSSAFKNIAGAAAGLGEEFLIGGDKLSDFTQHITGLISTIPIVGSLIGGVGQLFVSVLDNQIQTFRSLTQSGVDFGGSLFDAQRNAAAAGLSLETYQQVVTQNSESLALLAGSATEGARIFAGVSRVIQEDLGPQFAALGFEIEELAGFTADYLQLQTRLGRAQQMDQAQLAAGAEQYIMQLDRLAKITGQQRDEIAREMQQQALDKRLQAMFAGMDQAQAMQLQGMLSLLEGASPEIAEATRELMATGGVPVSDFAKSMQRLNPELGRMAAGLMDGTVSTEQYEAEVRKTAERMDRMSAAERRQIGVLEAMGNSVLSANRAFIGLANLGEGAAEAVDAQRAAMERGNAGLLGFQTALRDLRNLIIGTLLDSGVFQSIENAFSRVIQVFTSEDGIERLKSIIETVADAFNDLMLQVQDLGIGAVIKKYVSKAFSNLGDMIKEYLFGKKAPTEQEKAERESEITAQRERIEQDISVRIEGNEEYQRLLEKKQENKELTEEEQATLRAFETEIASAERRINDLTLQYEQLQQPVEETSGLIGNMPWGKMAAGAGIAVAALGVLGLGLAKLGIVGAPAIPFMLALGVAFGGLGYAAKGMADLIDSIAGSFGKMATGLKEFENLDPEAMKGIGTALVPLASVLMDLAKGGVVARFIGDQTFENLAAGLGSFQDLDVAALTEIGPALSILQQGIAAFTGDGILESAGKAISGLFQRRSGSGAFDSLIEDLKKFEEVDSENIFKVGFGLNAISNFNPSNLENIAIALAMLKRQIQAINESDLDFTSITDIGEPTSLIETLKQFEEIDSESMFELGLGLNAISNFDPNNLENIAMSLAMLKTQIQAIGESDLDLNFGTIEETFKISSRLDLDTSQVISYTNALKDLIDTVQELTQEIKEQQDLDLPGTETTVTPATLTGAAGGSSGNLDKLNNTLMQILETLQDNNRISNKSYQVTKNKSSTMW